MPYTTGENTKAASSFKDQEFKVFESMVLKVPSFEDIKSEISFTDEDLEVIGTMLHHVTVLFDDGSRKFILENNAIVLASKIDAVMNKSVVECVELLKGVPDEVPDCTCMAHEKVESILANDDSDDAQLEFALALCALQEFDITKPVKDQAGSQAIVVLFNMALRSARIKQRFYIKSANLESSCLLMKSSSKDIQTLNSRPDFICRSSLGSTLALGEIESSPYSQLIVACLGHTAVPGNDMMLGITMSKRRDVHLYWIQRQREQKMVNTFGTFLGPVEFRPLTLDSFSLGSTSDLKGLLNRVVKAVQFIEINKVAPPRMETRSKKPPHPVMETRSKKTKIDPNL